MLLHWLGLDDGAGRPYLFWSGIGSDLAYLGILWALVRKHNCEVHRCWRLARHVTAAGQHVCRRHHPDGHLTAEGVREKHRLYLGSRPGRG